MVVRVEGAFSPILGDLVDEFVRYALHKMMGDDACNLHVTVRFTTDVLKEGRWADVRVVTRQGELPEQYPTRFLMRVADTADVMKQLKMIGHEATHIKQFALGELVILETDQTQWHDSIIDDGDFDSGFEPWEVECRGMEWCLVESFVVLMKYNMKGWYYATV